MDDIVRTFVFGIVGGFIATTAGLYIFGDEETRRAIRRGFQAAAHPFRRP